MMHIANFHDAPSVTAYALVQERLDMAAREAIITEAGIDSHRRAYVGAVGHLLIRFGAWLQAFAQQPITMEETVQW